MEVSKEAEGFDYQYFVSFTGRDKYNNLQSIWRFFNSNKPVDDNTKLAFFIKDICGYFDLDFETVVVFAFNEVHTREK
jgi:hypothetical protein